MTIISIGIILFTTAIHWEKLLIGFILTGFLERGWISLHKNEYGSSERTPVVLPVIGDLLKNEILSTNQQVYPLMEIERGDQKRRLHIVLSLDNPRQRRCRPRSRNPTPSMRTLEPGGFQPEG